MIPVSPLSTTTPLLPRIPGPMASVLLLLLVVVPLQSVAGKFMVVHLDADNNVMAGPEIPQQEEAMRVLTQSVLETRPKRRAPRHRPFRYRGTVPSPSYRHAVLDDTRQHRSIGRPRSVRPLFDNGAHYPTVMGRQRSRFRPSGRPQTPGNRRQRPSLMNSFMDSMNTPINSARDIVQPHRERPTVRRFMNRFRGLLLSGMNGINSMVPQITL